jgi:hypothetical protein
MSSPTSPSPRVDAAHEAAVARRGARADAVELRLDRPVELASSRLQEAQDPRLELAHLVGREQALDREHRDRVLDGREAAALRERRADAPRRAVLRDELRVRSSSSERSSRKSASYSASEISGRPSTW